MKLKLSKTKSLLFRIFIKLTCILFPWAILFLLGRIGPAIIALILQATIIGWIPAIIWAMKAWKEEYALSESLPPANLYPPSDQK